MRAFDGSTFLVDWLFVDEDRPVLDIVTPFRSGRNDDFRPFDTDAIGEIPERYPAVSEHKILPARICPDCRVGLDEWWTDGWPSDAPPVVLDADGFAEGCFNPVPPVTSVGLALPPQFVVTGSPVTSIGVLSGDWRDIPEGKVLGRAPGAGTGQPDFFDLTTGTTIIPVRLTTPATTVPLLAFTTTISFGSGSPLFSCFSPADMKKINPGMLCGTFGARPDGFVAKLDQAGNVGQLSTDSAGPATTTAVFTPFGYGWVEQAMDPDTGQLFDKPGGRSGTVSTGPAFEISTDPVNVDVNSYGWLRSRGTSTGGIPVFDFVQDRSFRYSVPPVGIQNQTSSVTWDIFGSSGSPTTINLNANVNLMVWNGSTLVNLFVGGKVNPVLLNGPTCGNVLANTTATFATVFQILATNAIMGGFNLQNIGPNTLRYRLTATDAHGGPFVGTGTLPSGTTIGATDFMTSLSFFSGSIQSPCNSITFEVEDNSAGSHTQYRCWWVATGC